MAHSSIKTILPLDLWALYNGIKLTHFNQQGGENAPTTNCQIVFDSYHIDEVALAVQQAETMITEQLGFYPAPYYEELAEVKVPRNVRTDWWNAPFMTSKKYVQSYGRKVLYPITLGAPVNYVDLDNDPRGINETAIIGENLYGGLTGCDSDNCTLRVFFQESDGALDHPSYEYEIRPVKVESYLGGVILKAPSALFIKPTLTRLTKEECKYSGDEDAWINDYDESNWVTNVDIYCEMIDTDTPAGEVTWMDFCETPCGTTSSDLCITALKSKVGSFKANLESDCYTRCPPELLNVSYTSGYPLRNCVMDTIMQRAIIKLSNVLLPLFPCRCPQEYGSMTSQEEIWFQDRLPVDPLTTEAANMPWQLYSRGALEAWRIVRQFTLK